MGRERGGDVAELWLTAAVRCRNFDCYALLALTAIGGDAACPRSTVGWRYSG